MDIKQLNTFVTVADTRSFKEAAHNLFMSHSQVSKLVKSLEDELGYDILIRSKTGTDLTESGRKLYASAVRILKEVDGIEMIQPLERRNSFSVLASHVLCMHEVFADFVNSDNSCAGFFNFYESSIQPKMKDIYTGRYDIGFTVVEKARKTAFEMRLKENHLTFTPLKNYIATLYMKKTNPASKFNCVPDEALNNMRFVQLRGGLYLPRVRSGFTNTKKEAFDSDHVGMITNSLSAVFDIISASDMVFAGRDVFGKYNTNDEIVKVSLSPESGSVEFGYIIREDTEISGCSANFLDYVCKIMV